MTPTLLTRVFVIILRPLHRRSVLKSESNTQVIKDHLNQRPRICALTTDGRSSALTFTATGGGGGGCTLTTAAAAVDRTLTGGGGCTLTAAADCTLTANHRPSCHQELA